MGDSEERRIDDLFPDLPKPADVGMALRFAAVRNPVWSQHKANLIDLYLHYFVLVTRHGAYIDGFAGPQYPEHPEAWSAKKVIERRPRLLQKLFLCELDAGKIESLEQLRLAQPPQAGKEPKRTCRVLPGDFNQVVDGILENGGIRQKEATFALLDQRTFECHWATVEKLARYKQAGNRKIEIFYFWGSKWLQRSLSGISANAAKIDAWWGGTEWQWLEKSPQRESAILVARRFQEELGYAYAVPFPIYEREKGQGSIMYYMIHATDHPAAPGLMWRAYRNAVTLADPPPDQGKLCLE